MLSTYRSLHFGYRSLKNCNAGNAYDNESFNPNFGHIPSTYRYLPIWYLVRFCYRIREKQNVLFERQTLFIVILIRHFDVEIRVNYTLEGRLDEHM